MSDKQFDTFNFEFYPASNEIPVRLSFDVDVDEGLRCGQFHHMCKAFAYALGYQPATIKKYFGEDREDWLN